MHVAAVDASGRTSVVRALGCRVSEDRRRATVLLPRSQSAVLLDAINANHQIAVVFSQPETNKTIQLKGRDAQQGLATDVDHALHAHYLQQFVERLGRLHIPEVFVRALGSCQADDLVTVTFAPLQAFQQTPGGSAGERLPIGGALL